ncbi:tellurite resistance TerB family protein [Leucothrix sargassi]|nr:tellurite resistance TerB family protein [Leucothrix sargassi]
MEKVSMSDINKLLGSLLDSSTAKGFAGGLAGGMASKMIKKKTVKKVGKSALKVGGVAAIGALAYTAYKNYNNKQGNGPSGNPPQGGAPLQQTQPEKIDVAGLFANPEASAFLPSADDKPANDALGLVLVKAMIAAARSDGRLDAQESQAIFQRIESLGLDNEDQSLLIQEMGQPADVDAIINSATTPELAAEIYLASYLAITVDTPEEKAYLSMLAARLQLPPELVVELENQVAVQ